MQDQRYSRQREQIYRAVCQTREHPTAETVYAWLKPEMPRLSLGTVYRNLHQMAQNGKLRELPGPMIRFDANTAPHAHFTCTCCGAVSDVPVPYEAALDRLVETDGRQVIEHHLTFYGICSACAGNHKK